MIRSIFTGALFFFTTIFYVVGQAPFGPPNFIRVDTLVRSQAPFPIAVDVDNDGDMDVVSSDNSDLLFIYFNDGAGNFPSYELASLENPSGWEFRVDAILPSDLDVDGDTDLFIAGNLGNFISYLATLLNDGNGHFTLDQMVELNPGIRRVDLLDFDFDGDPDLLIPGEDVIYWNRNDGAGNFPLYDTLDIDELGYGFFYTDLTDDGDWDVVFASDEGVRWYENNGDHTFSLTLITQDDYAIVDTAADMDANGLKDLVVREYNAFTGNDSLSVLYQITPGSFLRSTWKIPSAFYLNTLRLAELSGDSLPDIMVTPTLVDSIFWFENRGSSIAPAYHLASRLSIQNDDEFSLADLNADGKPDILMNLLDDYPGWLPSTEGTDYDPPRPFEPRHVRIHAVSGASDINNDQQQDLVVVIGDAINFGARPRIAYINNGDGGFSKAPLPDGLVSWISGLVPLEHHFADLDGDGDEDIYGNDFELNGTFQGFYLDINWAPNLGDGTFGPWVQIDTLWGGDLKAVDLDNDSDLDLVTRFSIYDPDILQTVYYFVWYENDGSGNFSGRTTVDFQEEPPVDNYTEFYLSDVNLDGYIDFVLHTRFDRNDVWMLPGLGDGTFGDSSRLFAVESTWIDPHIERIHAINDFNGDSLPDILYSISDPYSSQGFETSYIAINANSGSNAPWPLLWQGESTSWLSTGWNAVTADFDADGDPDIVATAYSRVEVNYYENDGTGGFTDYLLFSGNSYIDTKLYAVDIDGDSDPDLVSSTIPETGSFWYENLFGDTLAFVTGRVYWDKAGDGLYNGDDEAFPGIALTLQPSGRQFFTGSDGRFAVFTADTGIHTIAVDTPITYDCTGQIDMLPVLPPEVPYAFEFQPFVQISQDFTFTGASTCREIGGNVYRDYNANGVPDNGEGPMPMVRISVNGAPDVYSWFDGYTIQALVTDTVSFHIDTVWHANYCGFLFPVISQTLPTTGEGYTVYPGLQNIDTLDFGLYVDTADIYEASIYTLGVSVGNDAGETFPAWIDFKTLGNIEHPCTLRLTHSPLVEMLESDIPPATQSASYVEWVFPVGSAPTFHCMNMTWRIADEAVQGDTLHWEATYQCPPGTDICPDNNLFIRDVILQSGPVRMEHQPAVLYSMRPEGAMPEVIDRDAFLSYVLYFQNPLPVTAYDVTVIYELPDALDPATVTRPFSSFADLEILIEDEGRVHVNMDDIRLPDAGSDPAGSYGFLQFNVRLTDGLPDGTVIPLEARVIFNSQREETSNEVIHRLGSATAVFDPVAENGAAVYPNPFREEAVFEWKQPVDFSYDIVLTDLPGRQVKAIRNQTGQQVVISSEGLSAGWYLLNVYSSAGRDLLGSFPVVVE